MSTNPQDRLSEIEKRLSEAEFLPWDHTHIFDGEEIISGNEDGQQRVAWVGSWYNADLIANAPEDIRKLLQCVRVVMAELDKIGAVDTPSAADKTDGL